MPKNRRQLRRSGFTLIELLAASMLAALLALAILRMASTVARTSQPAPRDVSLVIDLLRHDFISARIIETSSDQFSLTMYGSSPRRRLVTYTVVSIADHPWLIRRDSGLDTPIADVHEDLIAPDVAGFSVTHLASATDKLHVEIRFTNPRTPLVSATFLR